MGKLDGKIALITGGTSGIGEACAKIFAEEGAEVIIVGRNTERGKNVVEDIVKKSGKAEFKACDVTKISDIETLEKDVENRYGKLDILVNNAGVLITRSLEDIDEEEWNHIFNINFNAVMKMTKSFMPLLIKNQGTILNNASIDGLQSVCRGKANLAYAASKAAEIKFSQQIALNYASAGVRVNCLCPGTTETPFFINRDFSRFEREIPMGRVASPEEIAKAALFLVSHDASYITGAVLTVDGGLSLK